MAFQIIREINFRSDRLAMIRQAQEILAEYGGMRLTARQVFYQFVSRALIENSEKTYKQITSLLADARYAGEIDWDAIEDRGREPTVWQEFENLADRIESAIENYRLPRWRGQERYVELWVEKQALAGVLEPIAAKYHVTLMVNKGYSSASAMKEAADRCMAAHDRDQWPIIFYLGDHDPSGEDMVRDIRDRLTEFIIAVDHLTWSRGDEPVEVRKLALTMDQIRRFNPPPNPAKVTDSRARAYIQKYGDKSWEVDALPPRELNRIIETAFKSVIDKKKMDAVIEQEEEDKKRLRALTAEETK